MSEHYDEIINVKTNSINVFGTELELPIMLDNLKGLFGKGEEKSLFDGQKIYVWEQYGIYVWLNGKYVTGFRINLSVEDFELCNSNYKGQLLINDEFFNNAKWKKDEFGLGKELEIGKFSLFRDKNLEFITIDINDETVYVKSNKYELKHLDEPILQFDNFNFKLCIIQELMYNKGLLKPEFDVYEFAEEYDEREIDIDEEGYEPIKEVVDWFKKIEIPVSMASNIEEIIMDGGDDIYLQIIPFWDGEDDYFDVKDVTEAEIKQFSNLKKITLLPSDDNAKLIEKLNNYGIEANEV